MQFSWGSAQLTLAQAWPPASQWSSEATRSEPGCEPTLQPKCTLLHRSPLNSPARSAVTVTLLGTELQRVYGLAAREGAGAPQTHTVCQLSQAGADSQRGAGRVMCGS